jgi:peptide/nickel transport system substrate-binding protein
MRRIALQFLAVSSLLVAGALAATRPQYGGTLRIAVRSVPASVDPADLERAGVSGRNLAHLLFDTLTSLDDRGILQPALATSWAYDETARQWRFSLRRGITFSDGTPLTPESVAAALRLANPSWRISVDGESLTIQTPNIAGELPAELGLVRNCIVRRDGTKFLGTGPFALTQNQPGKKLTLTAREDYWAGRPFIGSMEINLASDPRSAMRVDDLAFQQIVEISPELAKTAGRSAVVSSPSDLLALVFTRSASPEEARLRDALSLCIDRGVLANVLLQGSGEPANSLLPNWMTGYGFLFSVPMNLAGAQQIVREQKQTTLTLAYGANNSAARLIAERIALNAADAGIRLTLRADGPADIRLATLRMVSVNPYVALENMAAEIGIALPADGGHTGEQIYSLERNLLQSQRVIPLAHLKSSLLIAPTIRNWTSGPAGDWHLADVWLGAARP